MIQKFDKPTCRRLGEEIEKLLAPLAEKHGLIAAYRGGRYEELRFSPKIEFEIPKDAEGKSRAEREFAQYCSLFDLRPEDYGKEFTVAGTRYRLTAIVPNRRRFPLDGERVSDGKKFKFGVIITRFIRPKAASADERQGEP